jgi:hypothetical protein
MLTSELARLVARREQLLDIKASGVSRASYGDKSSEFRSLDDLNRTLTDIEGQIVAASGLPRRARTLRVSTYGDKAL